jgi:hypothetical protein
MLTTYLCKFVAAFQQIFAPFCALMAKICISLFFRISASKPRLLLIINNASEGKKSNQIQRKFDSNVAIATFETVLASSHPRQKTNLFKPSLVVKLPPCEAGRAGVGITLPKQTESKGNFCLITVYNHKTLFQPQNFRAKKQTFSNDSFPPVGKAYSH